jgi:hypothetical protein
MRHLIQKNQIAGAKRKKPKPKPAVLQTPEVGDFKSVASYSFSEIVDLISEGPIAGLVNQNGQYVKGENLFQAVYLDDVPIKTSTQLSGYGDGDFSTKSGGLDTVIDSMRSVFFRNNNWRYGVRFGGWSRWLEDTNVSLGTRQAYTGTQQGWASSPTYQSYLYKSGDNELAEVAGTPSDVCACIAKVLRELRSIASDNTYASKTRDIARKKLLLFGDGNVDAFQAMNNFMGEDSLEGIHCIKFFGEDPDNKDVQKGIEFEYLTTPFEINIPSFVPNKNVFDYTEVPDLSETQLRQGGKIGSALRDARRAWRARSTKSKYVPKSLDLLVPIIDRDGKVIVDSSGTARVAGAFFLFGAHQDFNGWVYREPLIKVIDNLESIQLANLTQESLFNYNNVLVEYKSGEEKQGRLSFFKDITVDKFFDGVELLGPYSKGEGSVGILTSFAKGGSRKEDTGSRDPRGINKGRVRDYADWDNNEQSVYSEEKKPITHIFENPNVTKFFVTLSIQQLSDTINRTKKYSVASGEKAKKLQAGTAVPTYVEFSIETGYQERDGTESSLETRDYTITGLMSSPMILDVGRTYEEYNDSPDVDVKNVFDFITLEGSDFFSEFTLPPHRNDAKRFVRISKESYETLSVLLAKNIRLEKISEIVECDFSYPNSTIVGTKLDSRNFASIPNRSFDARLKKVSIPSNYFPLDGTGSDKRLYETQADFDNASDESKLIYVGDWDGTFKKGWTDNPAWILFDLLTNQRYGLGETVSWSDVNIWELYRIGKFCDAVDDDGYFVGVADEFGGKEPRFSCNVYINEQFNVFEIISQIASIFRGSVYYYNSLINFTDDRPRDATAHFSNTNVKNGLFTYSNARKDQRYNSIEVTYIDAKDEYKQKIEYIEDADDIRRYGVLKKRINTLGITSRSQARRLGKHTILQTIKENQTVTFVAGLETQLTRPGDFIRVDDELKTLKRNFGRVLDVNTDDKTVTISEAWDADNYVSGLTVYLPTGELTMQEYADLLNTNRGRYDYLVVAEMGFAAAFTPEYSGRYEFDGYDSDNYATYTGTGNNVLSYYTGYTGWLFHQSDSSPQIDDNISQLGFSGHNVSEIESGANFTLFGNFRYNNSGALYITGYNWSQGITDEEITSVHAPQIYELSVTGTGAGPSDGFGATLWIDQSDEKIDSLKYIHLGSTYSIPRVNEVEQVYKIIGVRELNPNEFEIVANKYDTGRYEYIENNQALEIKNDTFAFFNTSVVDGITHKKLGTPENLQVVTGAAWIEGGKHVSGNWDAVDQATHYQIQFESISDDLSAEPTTVAETTTDTFYVFGTQEDIDQNGAKGRQVFGDGLYKYSVTALSRNGICWPSETAVYKLEVADGRGEVLDGFIFTSFRIS